MLRLQHCRASLMLAGSLNTALASAAMLAVLGSSSLRAEVAAPMKVVFTRTNQWGGGYNVDVSIQNLGTAPIQGWTLVFNTPDAIGSLWNGSLNSSGQIRTVQPAGYNSTIEVGKSQNFGFSANTSAAAGWAPPSTCTVNGIAVSVVCIPPVSGVSVALTPGSASLYTSQSLAFKATVTGTTNTAVTWSASRGRIDATGNYTAPASEGADTVRATSAADPSRFAEASLTIQSLNQKPSITTHPHSLSVSTGQPVSFQVVANGTAPLTYQWQKDGVDLSGATQSVFSLASATASDAGLYRCVVSNAAGSITSSVAQLSIQSSAAFKVVFTRTSQWAGGYSADVSIQNGGATAVPSWTLKFSTPDKVTNVWNGSLSASGGENTVSPVSYNSTIPSKGAVSFGFNGSTPGNWNPPASCIVNGQSVPVTAVPPSGAVTVTVAPSTMVIATEGKQTFVPTVTGSSNTSVTWSATRGIIDAQGHYTAPTTAGSDTVRATSVASPSSYGEASITVQDNSKLPPSIVTQPLSQVVSSGQNATFTVQATGSGSLAYQWQKNQVDIPTGAQAATFTVTNVTTAEVGAYRCRVANANGSVYSNEASLSLQGGDGNDRIHPATMSWQEMMRLDSQMTKSQVKQLMYQQVDQHWDVISAALGQTNRAKVYALFAGWATRESTLNAGLETAITPGQMFGADSAHAYGPVQTAETAFIGCNPSWVPENDVPEMFQYTLSPDTFFDAGVSMHMGVRKLLHFIKQAKAAGCTGHEIVRNALKGFNTGWAKPDGTPEYYHDYPDEIAALGRWYLQTNHLNDDVFNWTNNPTLDRTNPWEWWDAGN